MTDDTKRAIEAAKDLLDGWFHASVSGEEMDRLMHVLRTALSALDRPTEQDIRTCCHEVWSEGRRVHHPQCSNRPVSNSAEVKRLKDQVSSAYTNVCPYCKKPVGGTMKGRLENPYCAACLDERMAEVRPNLCNKSITGGMVCNEPRGHSSYCLFTNARVTKTPPPGDGGR